MWYKVMMEFDFSRKKNAKLIKERGIGFEDVISVIHEGKLLDVLQHPNKDKFNHQIIYIVDIAGYAYVVPAVESEEKIYLKTVYPSRKATKQYILGGDYGKRH